MGRGYPWAFRPGGRTAVCERGGVTSTSGFPDDFMWGTAASSTQTEGASPRSDWLAWEQAGRVPASGNGNGFGTRYAEDFAQFAALGLTHHRLSLDWARLEPRAGEHDPAAVEHYREVLGAGRGAGLSIWVCLHHFTLPGWFSQDEGGFLDRRARTYFWARHVDWVAETFGDLVHGWKPVNEPVAYAAGGWLLGVTPPGRSDVTAFAEALEATMLANHEAWRLLHSGGQPTCTIFNLSPVHAAWPSGDERERGPAEANARLFDDVIWGSWTRALRDGVLSVPGRAEREVEDMAGSFDLIGFSYYNALAVHADLTTGPFPADARTGPLGYAPWPEGLGVVLRRLDEELPGRPLVIAECGLGTPDDADDDEWRASYLEDCLAITRDAITDGVDVRGFFHWTGVDNYEWTHGHDVDFGLIDRGRDPKDSADVARRWATGSP